MRLAIVVTTDVPSRNIEVEQEDEDEPRDWDVEYYPRHAESTYALQLAQAFPEATLITPKGSGWDEWAGSEGLDERVLELDVGAQDQIAFADAVRGHLMTYSYDVVEAVGCPSALMVEQIAGNHPTVVRMTTDIMDKVSCGQVDLDDVDDFPAPYALTTARERLWDRHSLNQFATSNADIIVGHGHLHVSKAKALGHARFVDLPMGLPRYGFKEPVTEKRLLVYVGRDEKLKGSDVVERVLKAIPADWKVTVVGTHNAFSVAQGHPFNHYRNITEEHLEAELKNTAVVLNTSKLMLGGRFTLQAFAHGKPVISFDPACPSKANWPMMRLGHYGDPNAFANIPKVLDAVMGPVRETPEKLWQFAADRSWSVLLPQYQDLYRLAVATGIATGRPKGGW